MKIANRFRVTLPAALAAVLCGGSAIAAPKDEPIAEISTSLGDFAVRLDAQRAPITVANFIRYADEGFYDGTIFHRVIDGFMVQGGGFTPDLKQKRATRLGELSEEVNATIDPENELEVRYALDAIEKLMHSVMREKVLSTGKRIDGRDTKTVRPITCEVGLLPTTHGSALFTRGETQALVATTLGTAEDSQIIDGLMDEERQEFMLNYNFPPFSVGECGRLGSPGRREIGHGKLAWRALHPMMPKDKTIFPYTVRVVSDIMESNGSSSMATVCGSCLSLMDAGVPLKKPVAGIAMGLIKEDDGRVAILTDILGDEDHLGDMDFKVAGTKDGVTALQMDIKITSITKEIMQNALTQAHEGRIHILSEMAKALPAPRSEISPHAPRIISIKIPVDKIREVIGTGGKVIREIIEQTNTKIDIDDDGTVNVAAVDKKDADAAIEIINGIVAVPEEGKNYHGTITKIMDFGAFVRFLGSTEGLVHISEIKNVFLASSIASLLFSLVKYPNTIKCSVSSLRRVLLGTMGKLLSTSKLRWVISSMSLSAASGTESPESHKRLGRLKISSSFSSPDSLTVLIVSKTTGSHFDRFSS